MNYDDFSCELQEIKDELAVLPVLQRIGTCEAERHTARRTVELRRNLRDLASILRMHSLGDDDSRLLAEISGLGKRLDSIGVPTLAMGADRTTTRPSLH